MAVNDASTSPASASDDEPIRQDWAQEGWVRWLFRQVYELFVPRNPNNIIGLALWTAVAVKARFFFSFADLLPATEVTRALENYLVTVFSTLLLMHIVFYGRRAIARLAA